MRRNIFKVRTRPAVIYILALLLIAVFTTLSITLAVTTNTGIKQSDNYSNVADARLAAESGLSFMLNLMNDISVPGSTTQETFAENLRQAIACKLDGTANLAGQSVSATSMTVTVPAISIDGRTFSAWVTWVDATRCRLTVSGSAGSFTRQLTMDLSLTERRAAAFEYGIASRGPITIFGNARIVGVNYPSEASVISVSEAVTNALTVDGSSEISGDLYVSGSGTSITISGSPTVAGSTDLDEIAEHVHIGVDEPDFPEINVDPLAAMATYTLRATDPTTTGTFNNLRIPAGMNPNFTSDVVLNGVVYVEAPNTVTFTGKCTLNGIVVTQDADLPIDQCRLFFAGRVEANGVEVLPDTPQFAAVKQETGTFILAPGFGVTFAGNFTAINGSIAADQLTFTGTAEGTVKGSVIGLADLTTSVGGNVDIYVDRQDADQDPAGFVPSIGFEPIPDTYTEL